MTKIAIDLSHHNSISNIGTIAKSVDFIIHKASEGFNYHDPAYKPRTELFAKNNVKYGAYHYAHGGNVQLETYNFIQSLTGNETILALDVEEKFPIIEEWCLEWLDTVKLATNKPCYIYMNGAFLRAYKWDTIAKEYPLWYARVEYTPGNTGIVTPWKNASIHQYSFQGRVNGIIGDVDLDHFIEQIESVVTEMDLKDTINVRDARRDNPDRKLTIEQWAADVFNMLTVLVRDKK